jgi:hypothetical protein
MVPSRSQIAESAIVNIQIVSQSDATPNSLTQRPLIGGPTGGLIGGPIGRLIGGRIGRLIGGVLRDLDFDPRFPASRRRFCLERFFMLIR